MIEKVLKNSKTPLKSEEIVIKTGLSLRSVRYEMKLLMESEKITKYPDLRDHDFYKLIFQLTQDIDSGQH